MDVVIRLYMDVSYYKEKKWVYGKLKIHCHKVTFIELPKIPTEDSVEISIPFSSVNKIHTGTSMLLWGTIVLTSKTGQTFWFSSFKDSKSVLKLLNYFHKSLQIAQDKNMLTKTRSTGMSRGTEMGSKLLNITQDSMSTLAGAAVMLHEQGEKLDQSTVRMLDIHTDLDVASRLTTGLEAWVGRWSLPKEYTVIKPVVIQGNEIPEVYDYEVLFTKMEPGKVCQQEDGVIQVSRLNLCVLDMKQKVLHQLQWSTVSQVRVISPWEMIVICYQLGKPDIKFSFVASMLIDVLHKLQIYVKHKMEYDSPNLSPVGAAGSNFQTKLSPVDRSLLNKGTSKTYSAKNENGQSSSKGQYQGDNDQVQMQTDTAVVSKLEVQELSGNLENLKSMMLALGEETDVQNEKLDNLTDSVGEASLKINHVNKRVNKLM